MPVGRNLKETFGPLIAAFQFLTRFPLPITLDYTETVFRRSVTYYPLVGAVLGLVLAGAGWGFREILPVLPASALLLALWVFLTGALHLDGLMDTADGILSHRSREQMLEIMKDSRVGAMGAIVAVLQLLLKASFLVSLMGDAWLQAVPLLVCIPVWSRWFMTVSIARWPYARQGPGLGSYFRGVGFPQASGAFLLALVTSWVLLLLFGLPLLTAAAATGAFAVVTLLAGWGFAAYISGKLGGLTGDTYGAINELLETFLLLAAVISFPLV